MIYYGAKELAASSRTVRGNTLHIAQDIPEDKFTFKPTQESRSVAQIFAHIVLSNRFQYQLHAIEKRTSFDGLDFPTSMKKMMEEELEPRSKAQIISLLSEEGEKWANWLEGLSDEFIGQRFNMPEGATPPYKSRFEMILSVKEHEMHHRAQLMLIERLLGIVPHLTREREARMAQMNK
jgi:uncharacterized damage-inducible protein DinB